MFGFISLICSMCSLCYFWAMVRLL